MLYKIELRLLATNEILEAYDWYELQKKELNNPFITISKKLRINL